jgi:hypothetical protein
MFIPIVELSQNRKILEVKVFWISTLRLIFSYRKLHAQKRLDVVTYVP